MGYDWPGNVRELENAIERMVILAIGDIITPEHIPDGMKNFKASSAIISTDIPDEGLDLEGLLGTAERSLLQKALEKTGGVKTEAAKLLGLSFRSFRHRLQKYESSS
ncbi:MAG: hypothetical protein A2078_09890 [Nitrospirae bacterium GWC2_57_9]|nr:MAG: hypothetical protein A2078_09890 [Nitrospirae bacterium GWC2_57_9]